MPSLPSDPIIHRSVYTRGYFSPSPWAKQALGLLNDTWVTFTRYSLQDVGSGNFEPISGPGPTGFLTVQAHVEIETDSGVLVQIDSPGPLDRRHWLVVIETPVDTATHPKRDDVMTFTDALGRAVSVKVAKVDIPTNMPEHMEIQSESFE